MRPHRRQPTRLPHPWDSPGKNTGVGCHALLQGIVLTQGLSLHLLGLLRLQAPLCTAAAAAAAEPLQSCPALCDPIDGSPPGFPVPGILQARTLEWGAMKVKSESEVAQSCPTPSNPMDCSLPGSSVHGIFQARVLEWGAIAFSDTYTTMCKTDS